MKRQGRVLASTANLRSQLVTRIGFASMEELGAADRTQAAYDKLHDDERADFVIDQKVREKKVMSLILQTLLRERLNMIWTLIAFLC